MLASLIASPGIHFLLSNIFPQINYFITLWGLISIVTLLTTILCVIGIMTAIILGTVIMNLASKISDADGLDDYEHSFHSIEYDSDGRPYCTDCQEYKDSEGGYYANNREERRALKRLSKKKKKKNN